MADLEFRLTILDGLSSIEEGAGLQVGFSGLADATQVQIDSMIVYLATSVGRLKEHRMQKFGKAPDQKVTGTEGEVKKTASGAWTDRDAEELEEENVSADGLVPAPLPE